MNIITPAELKARIDAGEKLHLIDVREPDEHIAFNIGGLLLPVGKVLTMQTEEIEELKNDEVICYCRSGQRSMQAALMLETLGYSNVKNLHGGMNEWQRLYGSN